MVDVPPPIGAHNHCHNSGGLRMGSVVNIADVPLSDHGHGEAFAARHGAIGSLIGARQLGCRVVVVPPGKKGWPYHAHHANEEMFVILEGAGTLRLGGADHPVKAGDVIACPAGGPETAHQIVNTGDAELRYLAISTMRSPELVEYPDSGKFQVVSGAPGAGQRMRYIGRAETSLNYWDGE
jgi:uncharacterized cupin superfamily protein